MTRLWKQPEKTSSLRAWLPTMSLGITAFIFVTTEMLPVGLLPDIAASLGKTKPVTGLLMTVYAWVVAVMSLPLTVLSASMNRRTLLFVLLGVFIAGNAFAAFAGSFELLMGARICIALAHAVFWSIVTPLATRVAPKGGRARALGIVVTGSSLAVVLGVPLGTVLGHHLGWRVTFAGVALVAVCVWFALWRFLPSEPAENAGSFRSLPAIVHNRTLVGIYLVTLMAVTGHFTIFTYFSPFMTETGLFSEQIVAVLLLVVGGAGFAGSFLGGKYAERAGKAPVLIPLGVLCVTLVLLPVMTRLGVFGAGVACFIWGCAFTFVSIVFQIRVLANAPTAADVAVSIYSGTFNVGIGGGALLGSLAFAHAGINSNVYFGAAFFCLAGVFALLLQRQARTENTVQGNTP